MASNDVSVTSLLKRHDALYHAAFYQNRDAGLYMVSRQVNVIFVLQSTKQLLFTKQLFHVIAL